jgi:hypothetical protein
MPEPFHGVLPALITPFTEHGSALDTDALSEIVDRQIAAGVAGLVPGGSTGEFTTLTNAERRRLVQTTVEAAGGRVPVIAGSDMVRRAVLTLVVGCLTLVRIGRRQRAGRRRPPGEAAHDPGGEGHRSASGCDGN